MASRWQHSILTFQCQSVSVILKSACHKRLVSYHNCMVHNRWKITNYNTGYRFFHSKCLGHFCRHELWNILYTFQIYIEPKRFKTKPHLLPHMLVPMRNISCHKPVPRERVVYRENGGIMWLICWLGCDVMQWGPSCVYTRWEARIIRTHHRVTAMLNVAETPDARDKHPIFLPLYYIQFYCYFRQWLNLTWISLSDL